jgi:hypothetical protein
LTDKQKGLITTLNRLLQKEVIIDEEYFDFMDLILSPHVQYVPYKDVTWTGPFPLTYETTCFRLNDKE